MAKMFGLARLGRDAEMRYTLSGEPVCNLSLAFAYGKKGDDGKRPTQWVDATFWGKRAESMAQYLRKGDLHMFTLDDVHIETYQKNGGGDGFKLSARVVDVELAGGGERHDPAPAQQRQQSAPASRPAPAAKPAPNFSDMDDDIPF